MHIPSVTAAMIWLSLPVVEVAVFGRAVLGRCDAGVLVDVAGRLEGYGALCVLAREGVLAVVPGVKYPFRAGMVMFLKLIVGRVRTRDLQKRWKLPHETAIKTLLVFFYSHMQ
jgi:hypothetical protein